MLWKRLTDLEHVMHVTKALHLAEYLLRHGAERFISDAKRRARDIAALQKYKHYDEQNQDDAKEARAKAKAVYALLMDDLLLAQERGKSSRLESEGRLGGYGAQGSASAHYADAAYGDEEPAAAAPAPRRQPSAASAAPRAAPVAGGDVPRSGALRRRSVDEDPFENPVIPAAVSGAPARRAAPAAAAGAAAPKRSAAAAAPAHEVDEPADEDEAAAEAKRIRKAAKKKKKEEEARKAAAALEQQTKAQTKSVLKPSAAQASSSASPPHAGHRSNGSFDLSNYAEQPGRNGVGGGEIDLLSGAAMNGFAAANGGHGGAGADHGEAALEDLFASSTLTDEQVSSPWGTGYHPSGNPFRSPNSAASGEEGEGEGEGESDQVAASAALSPTGGLVNLNDLTAPRVDKSKQNMHVDAGVSMSMMRSIQPLGTPQQQQQQQQQNAARRSNVPSTIPLPQYAANGAFPGLDPLAGAGGGYPQHPMQMGGGPPPYGGGGYGGGYPMQHGGGGYGQPQNPGMMMYGAHPGMHGGGQGPMLALMPPGMGSMGGYNQGPMGMQQHPQAYGGAGGAGPNGAYGGMPAPSPSAMTFTQMRQAPMKQQGNGPVIFEVPRAQPAPVDLMGGGGNSYGQQNQSQRGGHQQQQQQQRY